MTLAVQDVIPATNRHLTSRSAKIYLIFAHGSCNRQLRMMTMTSQDKCQDGELHSVDLDMEFQILLLDIISRPPVHIRHVSFQPISLQAQHCI